MNVINNTNNLSLDAITLVTLFELDGAYKSKTRNKSYQG